MRSDYSQAAHLIHSRVELVRHRLSIPGLAEGSSYYRYNEEIFHAAARSVTAMHGITVEEKDLVQAGELLLESFTREQFERKYYVVVFSPTNKDKTSVRSIDGGQTLIPADPDARWTLEEARKLIDDVHKHHMNDLRVLHEVRWEFKAEWVPFKIEFLERDTPARLE